MKATCSYNDTLGRCERLRDTCPIKGAWPFTPGAPGLTQLQNDSSLSGERAEARGKKKEYQGA